MSVGPQINVVRRDENGKPTTLRITEYANLSDRGQILFEAANVWQEINVLNMQLNGFGMTPKAMGKDREDRLLRERTEKLEKLAELKKRFDALADSPAAK